MAVSANHLGVLCIIAILLFARSAHAFGAGNIASVSKIEGQNWRHGDIEDVLLSIVASRALGGKFSKLDVKRVYFGNWLRDYSQAVDVGTVKYVSAKAITILLWVLGFMSFGYASHEFEVTMDRLGCYRPEEHIDNPKDYADNEDARNYDRRLRGPVDERRELAVDHSTGMKSYIASERAGITTSAGLVRKLFTESIQLGRRYNRSRNKADLYEALRLLGTGCHCLEDFSAHSNYVELALIEMGERDVFPHVGRNTQIQLQGARSRVYPLITGTFGGVDFLHSVTGEFDDKVTQSEIQELENTLSSAQQNQNNGSILQELLNKVPDGIFGGKNEAEQAQQLQHNAVAHQMQNTNISPRQPEEWTRYLDDVQQQLRPILEFHDEIMQSITEMVEKIPILPDLLENLQEQLNVFVFSLIAPFIIPIINQVKAELTTGSNEIIESSVQAQHVVFRDDDSTDPTHSMLSKDHFSNVLNEPAGKVAGQVLKWVVPQLMAAWDDEQIDIDRTLNRIIRGVMHHPAVRDFGDDGSVDGRRLMFGVVEQWWREQDQRSKDVLRDQLSRSGVEEGRNHKPGVHDHGHGSGKPLAMPGVATAHSSGAPGGLSAIGNVLGGSGQSHSEVGNSLGNMAGAAVGGGALGGLLGGLVGAGADILGGGLSENKQSYNSQSYGQDGSHTQTYSQTGSSGGRYGQATYQTTEGPHGGYTESYERREQSYSGGGRTTSVRHEERTSYGSNQTESRRYESSQDDSYGANQYQSNQQSRSEYGSQGRGSNAYGSRQEQSYGRTEETSYGRDEESSYGGRQAESGYGRNEHGGSRGSRSHGQDDYGRRENESNYSSDFNEEQSNRSYGGGSEYGQQERSYGRGGSQEEQSYGSGYQRRQEESETYGRDNDYGNEGRGYGRNRGQQDEYREDGQQEDGY